MGGYYTFDEIEENLDELSNEYPYIFTQKISIGLTLEGRNIWAIKVSDNPNLDEDEPEALYTGLHHAREPVSMTNALLTVRTANRTTMCAAIASTWNCQGMIARFAPLDQRCLWRVTGSYR